MNNKSKIPFHAGFVCLIGWTNVGKSTLLNRITNHHVSITSRKPQTTRQNILGIVNGDNYQIVFTDTPGIHEPKFALSRHMLKTAWSSIEGVDALLWMIVPDVDISLQIQIIQKNQHKIESPLIIVINKIDEIRKESLLPLIDLINKEINLHAIIPISALKGHNVDTLLEEVVKLMPEAHPFFPDNEITNKSEKFLASEIIRKYIIDYTYHEIPYAVAVTIESFKPLKYKAGLDISAVIFVEKNNQKGILIGKGGETLKRISSEARKHIEKQFSTSVNLKMWIKVRKKWRNDYNSLKRFGLLE